MKPVPMRWSWQKKRDTPLSIHLMILQLPQVREPLPWKSSQELPLVDYILVPIGGGGLATGVSTLAKLLNPHIKVIGVEPAGAACMKASLEKGEVVTLPHVNTIADGTAVQTPGYKIFPYIQENLDGIITVEDDELIVAFLDMVENHKMIVENSGLLTVAALQSSGFKE